MRFRHLEPTRGPLCTITERTTPIDDRVRWMLPWRSTHLTRRTRGCLSQAPAQHHGEVAAIEHRESGLIPGGDRCHEHGVRILGLLGHLQAGLRKHGSCDDLNDYMWPSAHYDQPLDPPWLAQCLILVALVWWRRRRLSPVRLRPPVWRRNPTRGLPCGLSACGPLAVGVVLGLDHMTPISRTRTTMAIDETICTVRLMKGFRAQAGLRGPECLPTARRHGLSRRIEAIYAQVVREGRPVGDLHRTADGC